MCAQFLFLWTSLASDACGSQILPPQRTKKELMVFIHKEENGIHTANVRHA
jgi:hypothetical protein